MEGKVVIMSLLFVSFLVLGQIQVEAQTTFCCKSISDINGTTSCLLNGIPLSWCLDLYRCQILIDTCPPGWIKVNITVNEYCKSRCVSSVCGSITTIQHSAADASEVVNEAVEKCSKACSDFCTNKAASVITTAVETTTA